MTTKVLGLVISVGGLAFSASATADFLRDGKATLAYKNYYYNNDNRDGAAAPSKVAEWAQGFTFDYKSGFTDGKVGYGLDALALVGTKLDSGKGRHLGSSMIPTDGDDRGVTEWSRFGLTGKVKVSKSEIRYGTLRPNLPVILTNDARVLTQTYEGGQLNFRELENVVVTAGRINRATSRASTDRTGLAVTGGTKESNNFSFAGFDWNPTKQIKAQYYYGGLEDYYTQHFFGLVHDLPLGEGQSLKTDLRYFDTSSSGQNSRGVSGYGVSGYTKNGDGEIDNQTWSATITYTNSGHSILAGYQSISDGSNFPQLAQGSLPGKGSVGSTLYIYTDRLIQSFNRAGEQTKYAQYGYDFVALGVPGLQASLMYLQGTGIKTLSGSEQSEWERDIALDYVIQSGALKGVAFAWRNGKSHSEVSRNQDQNRLIISYTLPIF